ncbi:MAG TPA: serine/threonine-protein kinase [Polyangia bacterium]
MIAATKLPELIASRYRPIRLIATGGMGAVYEVEHTRTGEHLALKVLLSNVGSSFEAIERFKREARASARVKSEHVVRVTDADVAPELDGAPFLVMELLEGMDLERAASATPPTPEIVVAWLRQVAQAIDKAHRLGIVHRDLKPENFFLTTVESRRSIVKVLDFGIAKMLEEGTGVTGSGQLLGTPRYMAPEQASPNSRVTPATDRCALGLIAYRLLVGDSYYQGGAMVILGQILHDELQPPSQRGSCFGSNFDVWFMKACHRDARQRFASASEQIHALAEALGLPRIEDELSPVAIEAVRSSPSRPVVVAFGVAVGLIAAASLVALLLGWRGGASASGTTRTASVSPTSPTLQAPPPPLTEAAPPQMASPPLTPEAPTTDTGSSTTKRLHAARYRAGAPRPVAGTAPAKEKATTEKAGMELADPYADQK